MDEFKFPERFGRRDFKYVGATLPANQSNDRLMGDFCHRTVSTIWHYHGGCLVGMVVDRKFRVMGIGSLRVVDGSTFSLSWDRSSGYCFDAWTVSYQSVRPYWVLAAFSAKEVREEAAKLQVSDQSRIHQFDTLVDASTSKKEVAEGVDLMVVRERTGGIYFGKPRGFGTNANGQVIGFNTEVYATYGGRCVDFFNCWHRNTI